MDGREAVRPPYDKKRIWRSLSTLIVPSFWVKVRLSAVAKFGARQGPGEPLIGANVQPLAGSTKYKEQRMARTEMSPSSMDPALQMRCLCRTRIPSVHGTFSLFYYGVPGSKEFHLAVAHGAFVSQSLDVCVPGESIQDRLVRGATTPSPSSILESDGTSEISDTSSTLVRIHSSCLTSETFGSLRCDCAEQLSEALAQIAKEPRGLVVYLSQEGRGIGLLEKLKAYNLIDRGHDTLSANLALGHPPDLREYSVAACILKDLGVLDIRLLTNNPLKVEAMGLHGISIQERLPMLPRTWLGVASDSADTEDTAHSSAEKKHGSESTTETILGLLSHVSGHHLHQYNSDKAKRNCSLTLGNKLDERDEYLVVKSQRMGHLMEPPAAILQRVQLVGLASGTSDESTPPYPKNTSN